MRLTCINGLAIVLALSMSCARVDKDAGFDRVAKVAEARGVADAEWNRELAPDPAVEQRLGELLSKPLSPDNAITIAVLNNASLQAAYEELGFAQADMLQAALPPNPDVSGAIRFPASGPGYGVDLDAGMDVLGLLLAPAHAKLAKKPMEATALRIADEVLSLATQTRAAYFELQGEMESFEQSRQIVQSAEAAAEAARRLFEAGNISELARARRDARFDEARVEMAEAESAIYKGREALNQAMGLHGEATAWRIPAALPALPKTALPKGDLESLAVMNSLALAAKGKAVEATAAQLNFAIDWRWIASLKSGVAAEREIDGLWSAGPSVSIAPPLWNRNQAEIRRLQSELRRSARELAAAAVELRSDARSARTRVELAHATAKLRSQKLVPTKTRILDLTQAETNFMLTGIFDLLEARADVATARRDAIASTRDYWVARTELDGMVGAGGVRH